MNVYSGLPKPFFVLAPMDDVTDTVFRQVVSNCARPDLFFTEFVNVDGLQSAGRPRLLKKLRFSSTEQPLIAQIWGKTPEHYQAVAEQISSGQLAAELGVPELNFAGIDINMGCPDKSIVNNGSCSALINNRELAQEIILATKAGAGSMPVSVKTRLGFNEVDYSWHELLLSHDLAMLTVHGRTRKEMSKVPARWDDIGEVVRLRDRIAPQTLIVGNGDVMSRQHGETLARAQNLDGVMVGRGIFQDPYLFATDSPWATLTPLERIDLYVHHVTLFAETWQDNERPIHTLNKFCKIYINGFDGAKELRDQLMATNGSNELLEILRMARTAHLY